MGTHPKTTADDVGVILAHAGLPPAPERRAHLAGLLPGYRERCDRLYAIDVESVEFDFLRPMR